MRVYESAQVHIVASMKAKNKTLTQSLSELPATMTKTDATTTWLCTTTAYSLPLDYGC